MDEYFINLKESKNWATKKENQELDAEFLAKSKPEILNVDNGEIYIEEQRYEQIDTP